MHYRFLLALIWDFMSQVEFLVNTIMSQIVHRNQMRLMCFFETYGTSLTLTPGDIRSHPETSGVARSRPETSGVARSRPESSGDIRSRPESSGDIRSSRSLFL